MSNRGKLLVALATARGPVEDEKEEEEIENEHMAEPGEVNYASCSSVMTCDSTISGDHPEPSSSSDYVPDSSDLDSDISDSSLIDTSNRICKKVLSALAANVELPRKEQDKSIEHMENEVSSTVTGTVKENVMPDNNASPSEDEVESGSSSGDESIKIRYSKKSKLSGRRKRDKRHCCYICQKIVCNLPRHFEKIHTNDVEISKIMALLKGSKQRRKEYGRLQRVGDFYHNCEVLRLKKGELILLRVPTPFERKKYKYVDYGPCPDCLGFMLKKNISVHVKQRKCLEHKSSEGRNCLSECNSLLNGIYAPALNDSFITNIINKFMNDDVSQVCKEDDLILKFGNMMFEKYDVIQSELIRQSMRQLGRLVIQLRSCNSEASTLSECLTPKNFDGIVHATKMLCSVVSSTSSRPEFKTPSLGLKIGYHLKKCIGIARGEALRKGNLGRNKELLSFLTIMDLEWNIKISSNALNTLHKRKFNSSQLLPLTADLIKLNNYLQNEMSKRKEDLRKNPSSNSYIQFASALLCRLVLFNKRRSGETAKMTIKQYMMRPLWSDQATQELKKSLSKFETVLAENMVIVDVEGKRGRKVPVILTPDLKSGMDLLLNLRDACGINSKNPFIFARSQDSLSHLRGHDCIKKFVNEANLEQPENLNATKLRKYIATVCQIFNLTENETDWLARHLGHDIRVHREFYRLHESAVELTKISRLLLAVDKGEATSFAGKRLEDIEISDLPNLEEDGVSDDGEDNDKIDNSVDVTPLNSRSDSREVSISETKQQQKTVFRRNPWSGKESEAVLKFFRQNITKEIVPRKQECDSCIEEYPVLSKRKWTDIKFFVKNHIQKIKKHKKGSKK